MIEIALAAFFGGMIGGVIGWYGGYKFCEKMFRMAARDVGRQYEFKKRQ